MKEKIIRQQCDEDICNDIIQHTDWSDDVNHYPVMPKHAYNYDVYGRKQWEIGKISQDLDLTDGLSWATYHFQMYSDISFHKITSLMRKECQSLRFGLKDVGYLMGESLDACISDVMLDYLNPENENGFYSTGLVHTLVPAPGNTSSLYFPSERNGLRDVNLSMKFPNHYLKSGIWNACEKVWTLASQDGHDLEVVVNDATLILGVFLYSLTSIAARLQIPIPFRGNLDRSIITDGNKVIYTIASFKMDDRRNPRPVLLTTFVHLVKDNKLKVFKTKGKLKDLTNEDENDWKNDFKSDLDTEDNTNCIDSSDYNYECEVCNDEL